MQKWQQKQKQKAHEQKVQNAKTTFKRYSNSRQKVTSTGKSKPTYTTKQSQPLDKILQIFQLQKYGPLLAAYGFPHKLTQKKSFEYIDQMMEGVLEKDKQRFLSCLNTLAVMSKDIQKNTKTPKSTTKSASKVRKIHYPPPPCTTIQPKPSPLSVQKSQKNTIKFRVNRRQEMNTANSSKNYNYIHKNYITQKTQKNQKSKQTSKQRQKTQKGELISRKSNQTRQNSITTDRRKNNRSFSRIESKATDDLSLVHDFNLGINENQIGILRPIKQSNKIIQKLTQKLQNLDNSTKKGQKTNNIQINLQMQKIKNMYLSFDSATLTSNIINIDLHQMISCLAIQIKQMITQAQVNNLARSNAGKIKNLLQQSFVLMRGQSTQSKNLQQEDKLQKQQQQLLTQQLPQQLPQDFPNNTKNTKNTKNIKNNKNISLQNVSLQHQIQQQQNNPSIKKFHEMRQIDYYDQQNQRIQDMYDTDKSSQQQQKQNNCSIDDLNYGMKQSSIWGNSYIASVINDFSCFDNIFEGQIYNNIQSKQEDIKNFIQLVVMAGRMEKQVPIIAYVYLNRLINAPTVKQAKVTYKNWRNLVLVTLIQASKIWDDQSLQNHSFAKLIKPYTTLQINRLEKYLVFFLDYRLTINQKQYSQAYFKLRKHVGGKQSQTVNMMRLDLKTIQKLQQSGIYGTGDGNNKKSMAEKKQFFKKLLNKSF